MLNHIDLMGRLTRAPELRTTAGGVSCCTITLACDRDYKDPTTGQYGVDFVDVVTWRSTAEFVCRYFEKGQLAVVSGRLRSRKYQDKNGANRTAWEVQADNVYFGGGARQRDAAPAPSDADAPPAPASAAAPARDFAPMEDDDSELPF